jgi:HK97 family phage major capsid protein
MKGRRMQMQADVEGILLEPGTTDTPRKSPLTDSERRRADELLDQINQLDRRILLMEHEQDDFSVEHRDAPTGSGPKVKNPFNLPGASARTQVPVEYRDLKTGQPVRVYERGAPMLATHPFDNGEQVSIGRLVRAICTGDWSECDAERRALAENVNVSGGFLLPSPIWSQYVDMARNKSICYLGGAVTVEMPSETLALARLTQDPTMQVKTENAQFTGSTLQFDRLNLVAKTIGTVITASEELVQDAPNVGQIIDDALSAALAVNLDSRMLSFLGTAPGTVSETGIGAMTWQHLLSALEKVEVGNGKANAYALNPGPIADLRAILTVAGDGNWLKAPDGVAGLMQFNTNQLAVGDGVLGDFRQMCFGVRLAPTLQVSREADEAFERAQVKVRLLSRGDFSIFRASAICVLAGITS